MILVDTSVWVDHLRQADPRLAALLQSGLVLIHPFVIGEIACGTLSKRVPTLELLQQLPMTPVADSNELLGFIASRHLHGRGIGYVDVHLLASTALNPGSRLWTRDKRLLEAAAALECAHVEPRAH
ncbi:MAG: type II toxin-antitoxin system VapC family toxin [Rhizobiales bacterium]|nr:type II toxin-antitoxin system VapC family toxin [Rhizobacter sp.]